MLLTNLWKREKTMKVTTYHNGYKFEGRVFSSMYLDWGFELLRDGETVFYNPCFLSAESYGFHYDDMDENTDPEEWGRDEWQEAIIDIMEEMICEYDGDLETMPW